MMDKSLLVSANGLFVYMISACDKMDNTQLVSGICGCRTDTVLLSRCTFWCGMYLACWSLAEKCRLVERVIVQVLSRETILLSWEAKFIWYDPFICSYPNNPLKVFCNLFIEVLCLNKQWDKFLEPHKKKALFKWKRLFIPCILQYVISLFLWAKKIRTKN